MQPTPLRAPPAPCASWQVPAAASASPTAPPRRAAPPAARRVQEKLDAVRSRINALAEGWSPEQRAACLEETPLTFKAGGQLVQLIAGYKSSGHLL